MMIRVSKGPSLYSFVDFGMNVRNVYIFLGEFLLLFERNAHESHIICILKVMSIKNWIPRPLDIKLIFPIKILIFISE